MTVSRDHGARGAGALALWAAALVLASAAGGPRCAASEPGPDDLIRVFDPDFTLASLRQQAAPEPVAPPDPEQGPGAAQADSLDGLPPLQFKPISELGVNVALPPGGDTPTDLAARYAAENPPNPEEALARPWPQFSYYWVAPASRHNPLYFEEVNAERYGYSCCYCLQPAISAAHFFATIPALPYLMTADCPYEIEYTLGHYRPGDCAPWRRHCWPCDCHAGSIEFLAVMSVIAVIP